MYVDNFSNPQEQAGKKAHNARARLISKRQLQLLQLAEEIEASGDESVNASYASRIMAQLSLPYRNPGDVTEWVRRNNALTLTITPGVITTPQGRYRGYPYGVIPRYLLTWMTTEAIKTRSRELELGGSLAAFMRQLGLSSTGTNAKRLMEQTQRLAVASMNIELKPNGTGCHVKKLGFMLWRVGCKQCLLSPVLERG